MPLLEEPYFHEVPHCRQRYNWDCGVSCVLMLLPEPQRELFLGNFHQICEEEGFRQSTWTIDLCYLLKRFGVKHEMYTTMMGVNEAYRKHGYYNRIIDLDRDRVQRRFEQAAHASIRVSEQRVTLQQIVSHLRSVGPVILLVDAGLLVCDLCKHNKMRAEFRRCFGGAYKGHYIVCVGVTRNKVIYRDPALPPRLCAISPTSLLRAHTAPGTDHDAILVYTDSRDTS